MRFENFLFDFMFPIESISIDGIKAQLSLPYGGTGKTVLRVEKYLSRHYSNTRLSHNHVQR